jgi:hypothetical protein
MHHACGRGNSYKILYEKLEGKGDVEDTGIHVVMVWTAFNFLGIGSLVGILWTRGETLSTLIARHF